MQPYRELVKVEHALSGDQGDLAGSQPKRRDAALPSRLAYGYTDRVALFWLSYRYSDGRAAGVVVFASGDLIHARLKIALAGLDHGLDFASGHMLDAESTRQIAAEMIGRLLDNGDLRRLQRMLIKKKPPAPSVRRRSTSEKAAKR